MADLARTQRKIFLVIGAVGAPHAQFVQVDGGSDGRGNPRLAREARQQRRAPDALARKRLRHT